MAITYVRRQIELNGSGDTARNSFLVTMRTLQILVCHIVVFYLAASAANAESTPDSDRLIQALEAGQISSVNGLAITRDYRRIYATQWSHSTSGRRARIVRYDYDGSRWLLAGEIFPDSAFQDYQPVLSPNEDLLLFTSTRPVDGSDEPVRQNVWVSEKAPNGEWRAPKLQAGLESDKWDGHAGLTRSGVIYFASSRNGDAGMLDIYGGSFTNNINILNNISELNSSYSESDLYVDPEHTFIIFTRYDPDREDLDLFYSLRVNDA